MSDRKYHEFLTPPSNVTNSALMAQYFSLFPLWITRIDKISLAWNPASVAANTSAEQAVSGWPADTVASDDIVLAFKPTLSAGLIYQTGCRVSAKDTVNVTFGNFTVGAIDPGSETWVFIILKV